MVGRKSDSSLRETRRRDLGLVVAPEVEAYLGSRVYLRDGSEVEFRSHDALSQTSAGVSPAFFVADTSVRFADIQARHPNTPVVYVTRFFMKTGMDLEQTPAIVTSIDKISEAFGDRYEFKTFIRKIIFPQLEKVFTDEGKAPVDAPRALLNHLGEHIEGVRDEILFSKRINDYESIAKTYWQLQQVFADTPVLAQLRDAALMKSCPTGGCFSLRKPKTGCSCSTNLPEVLVDLAIDYRNSVGDLAFLEGLKRFNKGRLVDPWYGREYAYRKAFPQGLKVGDKKSDEMIF